MLKQKFFYFEGYGNFSRDFGWDDGLIVSVKRAFDRKTALQIMEEDLEDCWSECCAHELPTSDNRVCPYFFNEHEGSREVRGFCLASSYDEARELVKKWALEVYPKVPYEE